MKGMDREQRQKLRQESAILMAMNHPNIVQFERAYKDKKDNWNIVMEFMDGGTLEEAIDSRKKRSIYFSEDEILDYFTQICLAVKHCHDRKVLHRDLQDSNILLSSTSNVIKLGDFSISKVLQDLKEKTTTLVGSPCGMAPEVLAGKPYNAKSDIW